MTVTKYNFPIEWAMRIKKNKLFIENNFLYKKKSNKLEPKYAEAGMFVIYPKLFFKSKFSFKRYIGFEVPLWSSVDIDDEDDFKFAEKIISSR
jgi:CMP-N-acetylneuraminic acid synthetase